MQSTWWFTQFFIQTWYVLYFKSSISGTDCRKRWMQHLVELGVFVTWCDEQARFARHNITSQNSVKNLLHKLLFSNCSNVQFWKCSLMYLIKAYCLFSTEFQIIKPFLFIAIVYEVFCLNVLGLRQNKNFDISVDAFSFNLFWM